MDFHKQINLWLKSNRHVSPEKRIEIIANTIEAFDSDALHKLATMFYIFYDEWEKVSKEHIEDINTTKEVCEQHKRMAINAEFMGMIALKSEEKVQNYQKGVKAKAARAKDNWKLANEYLLEEISKHKTLNAARIAAAKRAGIRCQPRHLVKMMPDTRKKT